MTKSAIGCVVKTVSPVSKTEVLSFAQYVTDGKSTIGPFWTYQDAEDACRAERKAGRSGACIVREDEMLATEG